MSQAANDLDIRETFRIGNTESIDHVSVLSKEIVVGFVGFAGAGCSAASKRLTSFLQNEGYQVVIIKMSDVIAEKEVVSTASDAIGVDASIEKFRRAERLQELGDSMREEYGNYAVAAMAIDKIRRLRGKNKPGVSKIAFKAYPSASGAINMR